jgi:hypothetical protein
MHPNLRPPGLGPLALALVLVGTGHAAAADTAFTSPGLLTAAGVPAEGLHDLQFALHAAADGGPPLAGPVTNPAVALRQGQFTTVLDFGIAVFDGAPRWLEISLRTNAADPFTLLAPRQRLTPAPYALHALRAAEAQQAGVATGVAPGSVTAAGIAPASLTADRIAAGEVVRRVNGLSDEVVLVAGTNLTLTAQSNTLTLAAVSGWKLQGNKGTIPGLEFLGTSDRQPLELRVQGQRALRLEPTDNPGVVNVIGGSSANFVPPDVPGATIAGGGATYAPDTHLPNSVYASFGAIGGGWGNRIDTNAAAAVIAGGTSNYIDVLASEAVVAGGRENRILTDAFRAVIGGGSYNTVGEAAYAATIGGGITNTAADYYTTIGGGSRNVIRPGSRYATIGGGGDNLIAEDSFSGAIAGGGENVIDARSPRTAIAGGKLNRVDTDAPHAAIGGGFTNRIGAGADAATIPGGSANFAGAPLTLAAGHRAHALHPGACVWADSTDADFASSTADEFAARATGGVRFVTAVDALGQPGAGVSVAPGSGSWSSLSDRAAKANFAAVDPQTVLRQLATLPIGTWNYATQPPDIRHIGPAAQDFRAAFGLGEDERRIATVDADGVALAAIQGLLELVRARDAQVARLEARAETLEARLRAVEARAAAER